MLKSKLMNKPFFCVFMSLISIIFSLNYQCVNAAEAKSTDNEFIRLTAYADSCMEQFDLFHAMTAYREALKLNDNCRVRRSIAKCHYRRAEFQECIDILKSISKLNNDSLDHEALREMFYSYGRLGQPAAQTYWGDEIIRQYPYDSEIVAAVSAVYCSENINQPFKALERTKAYLAVDSTNIAVLRQLADAYYFSNVFDRAADTYEKLVCRGDSTFNVLYSLGMSCWNMKYLDRARKWLTRAAEKSNFKNVGCIFRLGVVCNELDSLNEAIKYLRMADMMMQPDKNVMSILYRNLGESLYKNKEYNGAAVAWEKVVKQYGGSTSLTFNLAQVYGILGKKDKEIEAYKNFVNLAEFDELTDDRKEMIEQARKIIGPDWESYKDNMRKHKPQIDTVKSKKP